jgi:hypothetical protein
VNEGLVKLHLCFLLVFFALGDLEFEGDKYDFLTVNFNIEENTTLIDLAKKIKLGVERELKTQEKLQSHIKKFWGFCQRIETSIVKIRPTNRGRQNHAEFLDEFIYSLVDTVKIITNQDSSLVDLHCKKDGLVILIDEADKASQKLNLGGFLKSLSEKLVAEQCNQVLFVLVGLPKVHDILYKSHGSSLRMFEELELFTLSTNEVKEVIKRGLKEANEKNKIEVVIDDEALDFIFAYSEGYPHFVQQIGYSVFEVDSDDHITVKDVKTAMFMKDGALDLIGDRYYKQLYYDKIKNDTYRKILQIMANKWDNWITREEIKKDFSGSDDKLDNGLSALKKSNIILPKKGTRGIYRLQWASFAFWIKNFTKLEKANNKNSK